MGAKVTLTGDQNGIKQTTTSKRGGTYQFQNLPVGTYTLTFEETGFQIEKVPSVLIQEGRTGTINASLKTGSNETTIEVKEQPLLNQTDVRPTATRSTRARSRKRRSRPAALRSWRFSLRVSAQNCSAASATNAGLGNQPIWANGQRDTSNGFNVDGVDVTNLFNGKSFLRRQLAALCFQHRSGWRDRRPAADQYERLRLQRQRPRDSPA